MSSHNKENTITVYGASWCGFCHQLKSWLHQKNIDFTYIDIEEDEKAAHEVITATKQMGVPVTRVGDEYIIGFDRPKLEAALNLRKQD